MIWRLLHLLFGWDYIHWHNFVDSGIARVQVDGRGVVFYWRYRLSSVADPIETPGQVLWLTCDPSKYLGAIESRGKK